MPPYDHELAWHAANGFRDPKEMASELMAQVESAAEVLIKSDNLSDDGRQQISVAVSDLKEVYRLLSLFIDNEAGTEEIRWRFQFRLVRMMDNLMSLGALRSVDENFKHASSVHTFLISQERNVAATRKSEDLFTHIQEEARFSGVKLAKSEKFARIVQPGVCRRVGVPPDTEGYQWTAIKRAVIDHFAKKDHG